MPAACFHASCLLLCLATPLCCLVTVQAHPTVSVMLSSVCCLHLLNVGNEGLPMYDCVYYTRDTIALCMAVGRRLG